MVGVCSVLPVESSPAEVTGPSPSERLRPLPESLVVDSVECQVSLRKKVLDCHWTTPGESSHGPLHLRALCVILPQLLVAPWSLEVAEYIVYGR